MDHEQRINMKVCFKLPKKKSVKETHEMLKLVYGDAAVIMKTVYKWFERFESIQDIEAATTAQLKERGLLELLQKVARTMG